MSRSRRAAFTGSLYQLRSAHKLRPGDYVAINGPHDTYGVVLTITRVPPSAEDSREWLNLIRGVAPRSDLRPVCQF